MTVDANELMSGIDAGAVAALVEGRHGDPFSILGRHQVGGQAVVRALYPGALGIELLEGASSAPNTAGC